MNKQNLLDREIKLSYIFKIIYLARYYISLFMIFLLIVLFFIQNNKNENYISTITLSVNYSEKYPVNNNTRNYYAKIFYKDLLLNSNNLNNSYKKWSINIKELIEKQVQYNDNSPFLIVSDGMSSVLNLRMNLPIDKINQDDLGHILKSLNLVIDNYNSEMYSNNMKIIELLKKDYTEKKSKYLESSNHDISALLNIYHELDDMQVNLFKTLKNDNIDFLKFQEYKSLSNFNLFNKFIFENNSVRENLYINYPFKIEDLFKKIDNVYTLLTYINNNYIIDPYLFRNYSKKINEFFIKTSVHFSVMENYSKDLVYVNRNLTEKYENFYNSIFLPYFEVHLTDNQIVTYKEGKNYLAKLLILIISSLFFGSILFLIIKNKNLQLLLNKS